MLAPEGAGVGVRPGAKAGPANLAGRIGNDPVSHPNCRARLCGICLHCTVAQWDPAPYIQPVTLLILRNYPIHLILPILLILPFACVAQQINDVPTTPVLTRAHAHNDYEHRRPLLDALDYGFTSVEADVHLSAGELHVAHDRKEIQPGRTLRTLYLDPLAARVRRNGSVYTNTSQPLQLLVDIKTSSPEVWPVLQQQLAGYSFMLTEFHVDGTSVPRAVSVVLSGERPSISELASEPSRLAALDGSPDQIDPNVPVTLVPLVSSAWSPAFHWKGIGDFAPDEATRLSELVARVHAEHRKIRFWGTPDTPSARETFFAAGVDYLNTDDLAGMQLFFKNR